METLRRLSGKITGRQHDSAVPASTSNANVQDQQPRLTVDVRPQVRITVLIAVKTCVEQFYGG